MRRQKAFLLAEQHKLDFQRLSISSGERDSRLSERRYSATKSSIERKREELLVELH